MVIAREESGFRLVVVTEDFSLCRQFWIYIRIDQEVPGWLG